MSSNRPRQPGAVIMGLGLLALGLWLAARAFSTPLSSNRLIGFNLLWPIIPFLIGVALLLQFSAESRRVGLVFWGIVAVLMGVFMCTFTLHIGKLAWADMARYWPVIPAIIGGGFLGMFIADGMQNEALLRPAYLIGGFGIFTLPFTTGVIGGGMLDQVARYWYLLLIPLVILIFIQIRARSRTEPPG